MEFEPSKDILSWITTVQNKFVLGVLKAERLLPIVVPSHLDVMQGGLSSSMVNSDGQCPSSCWMRPTLRPPKWIQMIDGKYPVTSSWCLQHLIELQELHRIPTYNPEFDPQNFRGCGTAVVLFSALLLQ